MKKPCALPGWLGSGIKSRIFLATGSIRLAGIMLLAKAVRVQVLPTQVVVSGS